MGEHMAAKDADPANADLSSRVETMETNLKCIREILEENVLGKDKEEPPFVPDDVMDDAEYGEEVSVGGRT
jgi:hypothetical protein